MKAIKVLVLFAVALGLFGCSGSPAATPVACGSGVNTINCVPTMNGQRIDQARSCDSIVGQVLTVADETTICTLPDGTVETPNVTTCGNGQKSINFGLNPAVEGIEGQKAAKVTGDWSINIETCDIALNSPSPLSSVVAPTPAATVATTAPTSSLCILQVPAQMGTDLTPMTFVYSGADATQCAQYLAQQNAGKTGWEAAHPATIVSTVPAASPICTGAVGGLTLAVYGTSAAQYACSALGLK